jgi:protein-S-isoprenylcysteine O-methyltransferase Ste14
MSSSASSSRALLWTRGLIFTILVPATVAVYLPRALDPGLRMRGGAAGLGWLLIVPGVLIYLACLLGFLAAGGTPAIYFTRPLRHLIGEEPAGLVSGGLYRYSRNPMYAGVILVIFGQAVLFGSASMALYGVLVFVIFHLVVVMVEEPHLRATRGSDYEGYCRSVPRWLGLPRRRP